MPFVHTERSFFFNTFSYLFGFSSHDSF